MTPNTKIQNRGKAEQRKIPRNPKRRDDGKSPNIPKEGTVNKVKQSCPKRLMLRARDLRKISSLLTPPPKKKGYLIIKKNSDVKLTYSLFVFFFRMKTSSGKLSMSNSVFQDFGGFSVIPSYRISGDFPLFLLSGFWRGDFLSFRLLGFGVNLSRSMTPPFRRSTVLSFRLLGSPLFFCIFFEKYCSKSDILEG